MQVKYKSQCYIIINSNYDLNTTTGTINSDCICNTNITCERELNWWFSNEIKRFKLAHETSDKYQYRIEISFLEIYNENTRDLLVRNKYLHLGESSKRGAIVIVITFKYNFTNLC